MRRSPALADHYHIESQTLLSNPASRSRCSLVGVAVTLKVFCRLAGDIQLVTCKGRDNDDGDEEGRYRDKEKRG